MIYFKIFRKFPNLVYGVSSKKNGSMKLSKNVKENLQIKKNRQQFLSFFNLAEKNIVKAKLVHRARIRIVSNKDAGKWISNVDGLIAAPKNLAISITVADCFPVFIFDHQKKIISLVHAGWRPIIRGIIKKAIKTIIKEFQSDPKNILIGIGPGIMKCHFRVKQEVANKFKNRFFNKALTQENGCFFVDLPKTIQLEALKSGILRKNIEIINDCTYCLKKKYFSYRRDKKDKIKTMMAFMMIK